MHLINLRLWTLFLVSFYSEWNRLIHLLILYTLLPIVYISPQFYFLIKYTLCFISFLFSTLYCRCVRSRLVFCGGLGLWRVVEALYRISAFGGFLRTYWTVDCDIRRKCDIFMYYVVLFIHCDMKTWNNPLKFGV